MALAEALDGPAAVRSAAFAARGQVALEITSTNVVGVQVPVIQHKTAIRGSFDSGPSMTGVSSRIDEAAEAFEHQLDRIFELATSEMRLRRLVEEIGRTTWRVNALDNLLLPRLEKERDSIEMALEEREREDPFRLKRVKVKLQRSQQ